MPLISKTDSTSAAGAATSSGATGQLDNLGGEAFMQLLVAQMRYQNPMAPTDGTQYLAQISQYAMVEQLQKVTSAQQEISTYQRSMIANSFIGKLVAGTGEAGTAVTGQVLGVAFQAGRPVLVTTGGEISVDAVDEVSVAPAPQAAAPGTNQPTTPTTDGAVPKGTETPDPDPAPASAPSTDPQ